MHLNLKYENMREKITLYLASESDTIAVSLKKYANERHSTWNCYNVKIHKVPECIAIPKNVSTFNFVKKKHILFDKASEMSVN